MISDSTSQGEHKKEPNVQAISRTVNHIATALFLLAILGGLGYFIAKNIENVSVQTACENITGGYSCTLTGDNKNPTALSVCWSINRVCENGIRSSARKCQSFYFQSGKGTKSIIANSEFENNEKCDKVSVFAVEDVSIGTQPPPTTTKP